MVTKKVAQDFDAIIAEGRRLKNQELANQVFGRKSSPSTMRHGNIKAATGPSLASRVGVVKRSASTNSRSSIKSTPRPAKGNVDAEWTHDLHALNNPTNASSLSNRTGARTTQTRTERLYAAFSNPKQSNVVEKQINIVKPTAPAKSFSIKGIAGPYTVVAKNFAIGTTIADIESAMSQMGGACLECNLISERPRVIAELTFETKEGADAVIRTFHGQEADGNILQVYHKTSKSPAATRSPVLFAPTRPNTSVPRGPRGNAANTRSNDRADQDRYADEQAISSRNNITDGTYGFDDNMDMDDDPSRDQGRRLYSDDLIDQPSHRDRNGRFNDNRGRERNRLDNRTRY